MICAYQGNNAEGKAQESDMKTNRNQVTIKICKGKLQHVLNQARRNRNGTAAIDHVMRVLRHEYSDYDQQWKRGDWKLVSRSFAVEYIKLLSFYNPKSTSAFVSVAAAWLKREHRA